MAHKKYIKPLAEIEDIEFDGDLLGDSQGPPSPPPEEKEEELVDEGGSFLNGAKGFHSYYGSFDDDEDDY